MGQLLLTLVGVVVLVQGLLALAPGDAFDALPNADEARAVLESEWLLDRPLPQQVVAYLDSVIHGNLRTSLTYRPGQPVAELVAGPAMQSLGLLAGATGVAAIWGTALAWLTVARRGWGRWVRAVSVLPVFLLAHALVHGLNSAAWWAIQGGWIARPDWFALPAEPSLMRTTLAVLVLAVGSGALTDVQRDVAAVLRDIHGSAFVQAARGRGESTWPLVLRNLLPPLSNLLSRRVAFFIGGLVVVEKILLLNGLGSILWQAAEQRDYPLALGITLLTGLVVGLVQLGADSFRLAIDPRLAEVQP